MLVKNIPIVVLFLVVSGNIFISVSNKTRDLKSPIDEGADNLNADDTNENSITTSKSRSGSSWWNSGWSYRKKINVVDATNGYQMKLKVWKENGHDNSTKGEIDSENHCQADFDDIRFVKSDDANLLDYWIEETGVEAGDNYSIMWVETDEASYFYMYYGNSTVSDISNGTNTFAFFDDFEDGVIDYSKWNTNNQSYATYTEAGGAIEVKVEGVWFASAYMNTSGINMSNKAVEFEYNTSTNSNRRCHQAVRTRDLSNPSKNVLVGGIKTENYNYYFARYNRTDSGTMYYDEYWTNGTYDGADVRAAIAFNSSHVKCYEDGILEHSEGVTFDSLTNDDIMFQAVASKGNPGGGNGEATINVKFVAVRKYLDSGPTFSSYGYEEEKP